MGKNNIKRLVVLVLVASLILTIWNWKTKQEINLFIETQQKHILKREMDQYLDTISKMDREYRAEKMSWFRDLTNENVEDYEINAVHIERIGFNKVQVMVHQKYKFQNELYEIILPVLLVKEEGTWKDRDLNFSQMKTENFTIKYFRPAKRSAELVKKVCEEAKDNIERRYGEEIEDHTIFYLCLF